MCKQRQDGGEDLCLGYVLVDMFQLTQEKHLKIGQTV